MIAATDATGVQTTYAYDAAGNQIRITYAANTLAAETVTFGYDLDNRLITQTDALGNTTSHQYDANGNAVAVTDALGHTTRYTYDVNNRVESITDPLGNVVWYYYDGNGNRVQVEDERGFTTTTYYNADNEVILSVDNDGYATSFAYDANGNVISQTLYANALTVPVDGLDPTVQPTLVASAADETTLFTYDAMNWLTSHTDGEGYVTQFVYDLTGNRIQTRRALDRAGTQFEVTHSYYDAVNRQVANVTALGYMTTYQYDVVGNRVGETAYDQVVSISPNGIVPQPMIGDGGRKTALVYDADNRLVQKTDALGAVTTYQYDARSNLIATTQGAGTASARTSTYQYDAANRNISNTNALGITTFLVLDASGNVLTRFDAFGTSQQRESTFTYDANNRVVSQTDPLGIVTLTAYDAVGSVISRTAAAGTATAETSTSGYDGDRRLISSTDAVGAITSFAYDAAGNKVRKTEAVGTAEARTIAYVYDRANRLIAETDPLGVVTESQYDGLGNQLRVIEAVGTAQQRQTSFEYDLDNRLTRSTDPLGRITQFQYDAQHNQTQIIDAKGNVETNTFDALGNELTSLSSNGVLIRNTYDLLGNRIRTTQSFADGSDARTVTFAYDLLNRQTLATDAEGFSTSTVYDDFGNQISVTDGQYLVSPGDPLYSAAKAAQSSPQTTTYTYDAGGRVVSTTDALGQVTAFTYDSFGNRTSKTDANGHVSRSSYDFDNRLIAETDALGNTLTKRYDLLGNLVAATDALGNTTSYTYDADGRATSTTDAVGSVTRYQYDALGNRVQVIDPRGFVGTTYYNADKEVVLSVDNDGYATGFTYDANGNILSQTLYAKPVALPVNSSVSPAVTPDPLDRTTAFAYDGLNRLVSRSDGEGYVTQYQYDSVGNLIETRQALDKAATQFAVVRRYYDANSQEVASVSAQGYLTIYRYDAVGNRVGETQYNQIVSVPADATIPASVAGDAGRTTTFAYDAANRLIRQTDPQGVVTAYQYDAKGNRVAQTEAAGTADARTTTYQYDAANRYVATTNALGITTSMMLDADGNVLTRYDAYGSSQQRVTRFTYDSKGRVVSEIDPLGVVTQTAYDAAGNLVSKIIAAGTSAARSSGYTYDGDGRETGATDALGTHTSFAYDAEGNQIQVTQAVGLSEARSNGFQYDRANRLVAATDALGTVTQYQYDGAGNKILTLQAVGTAQQSQTAYRYDLDNRLVQVTDPLGGVTKYEYDAQGNQTKVIDANGGVQINTFDASGQVLTSVSAGGVLTQNTYDLRWNLIRTTQSFVDGSGARTSTYAYDLLNRQIGVTDGNGFSTTIAYDDFGNQLSITHGQYLVGSGDPAYNATKASQAAPRTNLFTYDADNRMLSMTDGVGDVISYQYDAVGNRTSVTDGNGYTTQFTYDLLNRLTQITNPDGGVTRNAYDHVGNKVSQSQLQSGDAVNGVWATTSYQHDANGHVISQADPLGVVTQCTYDAMGNKLSQTTAAGTSDARTVRWQYDLDNWQIAAIDALGNRTSYTLDALGNQTQVTDSLGNVAHYYYDAGNQLTEVVDPLGYVNAFSYDAAGNRTQTLVYMTPVTGSVDPKVPPIPVTSGLDRITTDQFDAANQLIKQTAPDGSVTLYSYDGAGNKVLETQFANTSASRVTTYAYDASDRLIRFTDVDGTVTTYTYDQANNKTSQSITNSSDPNPTLTTAYTYDADNRKQSETFDPLGLDIVQSFTYDHLGNVRSKTDGDGHTSTFTYDLNNRQVSQTDPLGNTATFTYDRVGNKIASTDALSNTTNYVYDANNRLTKEIQPQVQIYTVRVGFTALRPTTTHVYDGRGNEIQTVDASGNVTTNYYDGEGRLIAQVNADNALTMYGYDGAGDKISQTLYMTRLSPGSYSSSTVPTPPAGGTQAITYIYDLMGRLTLTTYPPAQITTLANTNTNSPRSVTVTKQVTEQRVYDAYGNVVQSVDRNGNKTLNYYDVKDNKIASVDAAGYLTQWDYDSQGNMLEQRVYTQALDPSTLSLGTPPSPPSGDVYVTDIRYDAASRKTRESDPQIATFDSTTQTTSQTRPTTAYTYDKVGNQITKTLGAGTAQAVTETSYYDADNRVVAVIDGGRVLSTYRYDANGNLVAQKRYSNPVPASVNLTQLSGSSNFASLISVAAAQDEETDYSYDAIGHQRSQSDLLSSVTLTKTYAYDSLANRTYTQDEDGYVTQARYDGMARLVESISPDGSSVQYQYDAAGNQILAYTGTATAPAPATINAVALGSGILNVTWTNNTQSTVQSWVVYDSTSHTGLVGYAHQTGTQTSTGGQTSASISAPGGTGTLYYRVVTEDGYGNLAWTGEESVKIPPRFSAVSVSMSNAGAIVVSAQFDAGVVNPSVVYGANGNLSQSVAFVQRDGSYQATLPALSNPAAVSFALQWQDAAGVSYSSATSTFGTAADQVGTTTLLSQSQIVNGANTAYTVSVSVRVPTGYVTAPSAGLVAVQAQWRLSGSGSAYAETAVTGTDSQQGFWTYSATLGNPSNLAAGTYEIVLTGVRANGTSVELDHFNYVVGTDGRAITRSAISESALQGGNDQLVIIGGQNATSTRDQGRIVVTDPSSDTGSTDYATFYGQDVNTGTHTVSVASTGFFGLFIISVQATFSAAEAANIGSGGVHIKWRPAGGGTGFTTDAALSSSGTNAFSVAIPANAGQYDMEMYYVDAQGKTVIVEWRRINAATASTQFSGKSLTVQAQDSGGSITTNAQGVITVSAGVYTGALNVAALSSTLSLNRTSAGNAGGSQQADGRQSGHFVETQYNALNYEIASNAGDGLWRQLGVDGNGNAVQTDLLGDRSNPAYNPANTITTYTAYDGRNRKIADFGAMVPAAGGSGLVRAVDRYTYDVNGNVTSHTDALNNTTRSVFNALGTQIQQIDPYGQTTQALVDQFGNVTAEITQKGNRTLKLYDLQGNLIKEIDPAGDVTTHTYNSFNKLVSTTSAVGNALVSSDADHYVGLRQQLGFTNASTGQGKSVAQLTAADIQALLGLYTSHYTYDQRDRLTSQTDPMGNTESFVYDGRNDRIKTLYPLGEETDEAYDGLGRVTDTITYLDAGQAHDRKAYDAYGNLISETDAMGRTQTNVYGAFGRLLQQIDQDGNVIAYNYDVYGRKSNAYDPNAVSNPNSASDPSGGKDIQYNYDAAGRTTSINDLATGVADGRDCG
jgi:YD repeat-containing protein